MKGKIVVKANELIQKSRFNLSVQEQKILLYLIAQVEPSDEDFKLYEFDIIEFCRICGINTSGKNYSDLRNALLEIAKKQIDVFLNGRYTNLQWISKYYLYDNKGTVQIRLDNDMKPFLLQLKRNFTQYSIMWTLHFKSKYSIRLYELAKSIHYDELQPYTRQYEIEELKRLLDAENYALFGKFKEKVLSPAINEINQYSDKILSYETVKTGKKITGIKLTVQSKNELETLAIKSEIEKELGIDENQMSLWE